MGGEGQQAEAGFSRGEAGFSGDGGKDRVQLGWVGRGRLWGGEGVQRQDLAGGGGIGRV